MNGNKAVAIIDMPTSCLECPFLGKIVEQPMGNGVYRKIARCCFLEDDYEDVAWLLRNKFDNCPLIPLSKEFDKKAFSGRGDWVYCEDCIYCEDSCQEAELRDGCYFGETKEETNWIYRGHK